jgi:hypothetical protein
VAATSIGYPSAMPGYGAVQDCALSSQQPYRADFIGFHQTAESGAIGGEHRSKSAFNSHVL